MNDPHVEALIYRVEHLESTKYVGNREFERPGFRVKIEDDLARFEMKDHYSTVPEAQAAVQPFIDQWEFVETLTIGPGQFALSFNKPEMIERQPTPGVVMGWPNPVRYSVTMSQPTGIVSRPYPEPPPETPMDIDNPDVQTMLHRYGGYRRNREPLPSMAYFCCEVFTKRLSDNARDAADKHQISHSLIRYVNNLASNKGGAQARHAHAVDPRRITKA